MTAPPRRFWVPPSPEDKNAEGITEDDKQLTARAIDTVLGNPYPRNRRLLTSWEGELATHLDHVTVIRVS